MQVKTKAQATADGDKKYFNAKPCPHGHLGWRWTRTGVCVECTKAAKDAWALRQPKERLNAYTTKHRAANSEKLKAAGKLAQQKRRDTNNEHIKSIRRASYARVLARQGVEVQPRWKPLDESVLWARLHDEHRGAFTYVPGSYKGMHRKIPIFCGVHTEWFDQTPASHLKGAVGCTKCNHMKSAPEDAVAQYLSLFTEVQRRDRKLIAPYELDIVLPEHKLAVEYCGEYFHSAGDIESEAKMATKHIRKHQAAAAAGYRLITIFGTEWEGQKAAIKRLLRNAVGKGRGKLMARKCELRGVSNSDATTFYGEYHPQGGAGYGEHYGLYWRDKLVACMRFVQGSNDRGNNKDRVWTLSRYATRVTVAGGASRLFTAFVTSKNPKQVKSFSDNRYFDGGVYPILGFTLKGESAADYMVWHQRLGLRHKSHWQRREIQDRAKQLKLELDFDHETDPRTERDMTYLLEGRRIYDCGKKTWVWTNPKSLIQ